MKRISVRRSATERFGGGAVFSSALLVLLIAATLVYQLSANSAPTWESLGWNFLISTNWSPAEGEFGALPFLYGTLVTSAIALFIAVPVGLATAIFLAELAPRRISDPLTFLIELLAAVPSVIYGLLGVFVVLPLLKSAVVPALKHVFGFLPILSGTFYGVSFLSAGIILAVMIVPFIVSVSREVLLAVPPEQRGASLALGATRWETIWKVVLPYGRTGIFAAIFLALARALGETMAVTMVIGNSPQITASLLAPGYTAAAVIANEFGEAADENYLSALIALALVLFGLTILVNGLARFLIAATERRTP